MSDLVAHCLAKIPMKAKPTYDDYVQTDAETRRMAGEFCSIKAN
jgi:1-deoxy-D-xylulose-5-phosphate reductoisomerase